MISLVVPPTENVGGENRFVRPISSTFKGAVAGLAFVTPCCVPRALAGILLVYLPCVSEVTLTVIMQEELGAIVPLLRVTDVPPAAAATEADAPHPEVDAPGGSARKTPAGRLSVNETWVRLRPDSLFAITMDN